MKFKFVALLFFVSFVTNAQLNYSKSTWYIKGNASSLIDIFTFPTLQLSVEKQISDYFSINTEGGYQLYSFHRSDTGFLKPSGFKVNLEIRYYLSRFISTRYAEKTGRLYMGLRPFFSQNQYNTSISYKINQNSPDWIDDDYAVENMTYGVNFIFGFQKSITEKLIMDMHAGVGIMDREVENSQIGYVNDSGYILAGTKLIQFLNKLNLAESSGIKPNILFGFRIGYKIYK